MNVQSTIAELGRLSGRTKLDRIASMLAGPSQVSPYRARGQRFNNLYRLHGRGDVRVAITAHHDTVNPSTDNCIDNNASVVNLVGLDHLLDACDLPFRVVLGWTDSEETCSPDLFGVGPLIEEFEPLYLIDIEVTARGRNVAHASFGGLELPGATTVTLPLNNARMAWNHRRSNLLGAVCCTLVDDENLQQVLDTGTCELYRLCHHDDDSAAWAVEADMENFRRWLVDCLTDPGMFKHAW